ncbi:MAG: hypothetical protein Kilf2KO_14570 [Rhodospirillales bacterium]
MQPAPLSAEALTETALRIVRSRGSGAEALAEIAGLLASFATALPRLARGERERVLRTEPDGTFLLLQRDYRRGGALQKAEALDTWRVHAPCSKSADLYVEEAAPRRLEPGEGAGFAAGTSLLILPVKGSAQLVSLYGIAPEHLPPPRLRRVCLTRP